MKTITLIRTLLLIAMLAYPVLSHSVEKGLVAYWAFEEGKGDTASDSSDNGHDGELLGDPQWTDGYFGGGLEFDQAGDEVNVPFHKDLNTDTFTVTVTAWANVEDGSAGHRAVISSRHEPPVSGYLFYCEPGNTWQFWTGDGGWKSVQGPAVNIGEWEHLAGTVADNKMNFYVNGEHIGEQDSVILLNTQQEFLIGAGANERAVHEYLFKGIIDEVRIYNRALNADEIASVMENDLAPVEPSGKLATTWAKLKAK